MVWWFNKRVVHLYRLLLNPDHINSKLDELHDVSNANTLCVCAVCTIYVFVWYPMVDSDIDASISRHIRYACASDALHLTLMHMHTIIYAENLVSHENKIIVKWCFETERIYFMNMYASSTCKLVHLVGLLSKISTFLSIKWSISGFYLLCRFILFSSIFYHHSFIGLLACLLVHRCLFVCADVDRFITEAIISKGNWNLQQFRNYRIVLLYYRTTLIAPGSTANKCLILQ